MREIPDPESDWGDRHYEVDIDPGGIDSADRDYPRPTVPVSVFINTTNYYISLEFPADMDDSYGSPAPPDGASTIPTTLISMSAKSCLDLAAALTEAGRYLLLDALENEKGEGGELE